MNTGRIFSEDIGMEFSLQKCVDLVMKQGKLVEIADMRVRVEENGMRNTESYVESWVGYGKCSLQLSR